MIIDTEYKSLNLIDEEIRDFYSYDTREKFVGYDEVTEKPITEEYTVVVLNVPEEVSYQDVNTRRYERKDWETVVKQELLKAIEWENFRINHEAYLVWKEAFKLWEQEQPTDEEGNVLSSPERPVIDITNRREVYEVVLKDYDYNYVTPTGEFVKSYDDENLICTKEHVTTPKEDSEIINYHSEIAFEERYNSIYSPIPYNGSVFQVGKGKDDIYGIDNFKGVLDMLTIMPERLEEEVNWICEDNSITSLNIEDIKAIVALFINRQQDVFEKYTEWRASDMLEPFNYN